MRLKIPIVVLAALFALAWPGVAAAQEDGQSPSLGDLARNLRKEKAQKQQTAEQQPLDTPIPSHTVIDNDNLPEVMEEASRAKPAAPSKTIFSVDPSGTLKVSSPDVTCSMSFNARASSLLLKPVLVEDLPLAELVKLDGPGFIQDDNLQLEIFNGSDWVLREITIGLTLERKPGEDAERASHARVIPAAESTGTVTVERHSDVTLLYHLKTEARPFSSASLRENIGITPGPDEDWRWSIVEAKGIRPEGTPVAPASLSEPLFGNRVPSVPSTNLPPDSAPPASPVSPQK